LGITIALSGICDVINKKLNLRYKKILFDTGQNSQDIQEVRENWKNGRSEMDDLSIVVLDENSVNISC
jgi:ATP:corrinoid adenosyltransferase